MKKLFCIAGFSCCVLFSLEAKGQVRILFEQPPTGALPVSSFTRIMVNNSTNGELSHISLHLTVNAQDGKELAFYTSNPVTVAGGISRPFERGELTRQCRDNAFCLQADSFNSLPSGNYSLIFALVDREGKVVSQKEMTYEAKDQVPIKILNPASMSSLRDSAINFEWTIGDNQYTKSDLSYTFTLSRKSADQNSLIDILSGSKKEEIKLSETHYTWIPDSAVSIEDSVVEWKVAVNYRNVKVAETQWLKFYYIHPSKIESDQDRLRKYIREELSFLSMLEKDSLPGRNALINQLDLEIPFGLKMDSSLCKQVAKKIRVEGAVEIGGRYSGANGYLPDYPQQYGYVRANPTATIGILPLKTQVFYSTVEGFDQKKIGNVSVGFDAGKFKENLRQKLLDKSGLGELDKMKTPSLNQVDDQIKSIDEKLKDTAALFPAVQRQAPDLRKSYDSILASIDTSSIQSKGDSLYGKYKDSLGVGAAQDKMYKKLDELKGEKDLLSKRTELEKLKKRKAQLLELREKIKYIEEQKKRLNPEKLKDEELLKSELKKKGLLTGPEKYLFEVDKVNIGNVSPDISPYVMYGYPVKGIDAELSPGRFFFGFSGGVITKVTGAFAALRENKQPLTVFRAGLGSPQKGHLHIIVLQAKNVRNDEGTSENRKNMIVGVKSRLVSTRKLTVEGQYFRSLVEEEAVESNVIQRISKITNNLNSSTPNSVKGDCMSFKADYEAAKGTTIKVEAYKIGPGYESIIMPFLNRDIIGLRTRVSQKLIKNKLLFEGFYQREADNLISWKKSQTKSMNYAASFTTQFDRLPNFSIEYSPYILESEQAGYAYSYKNNLLTASASHPYNIFGLSFFTSFFYTESVQPEKDSRPLIILHNYSLTNTIQGRLPVRLTTELAYGTQNIDTAEFQTRNFIVAMDMKIRKKYTAVVGARYSEQMYGKIVRIGTLKLNAPLFKNWVYTVLAEYIDESSKSYLPALHGPRFSSSLIYSF